MNVIAGVRTISSRPVPVKFWPGQFSSLSYSLCLAKDESLFPQLPLLFPSARYPLYRNTVHRVESLEIKRIIQECTARTGLLCTVHFKGTVWRDQIGLRVVPLKKYLVGLSNSVCFKIINFDFSIFK